MKKIITLSIALVFTGVIFAQDRREEARRVVLGEPKNERGSGNRDVILGDGNESNRNYPTSTRNYPYGTSAEQVNRDYDAKIRSIRNNPTLTQDEKERMIRQLEKDRAKKLKDLRKGKDDHKYKSNNGKHKGWTKGKGNQKKARDRDDD